MASTEGGMEIEEVAAKTPEKIIKVFVNPAMGLSAFQIRKLAFGLGLDKNLHKGFSQVVKGVFKLVNCRH